MKQQALSDIISRINVARRAHMQSILIPNVSMARKLLSLFETIGLIRGYTIQDYTGFVEVLLKYNKSLCIIDDLKQISKPSRRIYVSLTKLKRMKDKHNKTIYIISTTRGLLLDSECLIAGLGGEVLVKVVI